MLLSMWHIADALAAHRPVVDIREGEAHIAGIRFIVSGEQPRYDPRYIYLYPDADDASSESESVFLSNGRDIISVHGASANELLNEVLEVFDEHNAWESELWRVAAAGTLVELVDVGQRMLGNPIMLADVDGRVLALSSVHRNLDLNEYWVEARDTGFVPAVVLGSARYTEAGRPTRFQHVPEVLVLEDGTRTIGAALQEGKRRVGGIALWEWDTPIVLSHVEDMKTFCRVLESTLPLRLSTAPVRTAGAVLADFLDGQAIGEHVLRTIDLGKPPLRFAAVWSTSQEADSYSRNLVERFENCGKPCVAFRYHDSVFVVAAADSCERLLRGVLGKQARRVFSAALSLPFAELSDMREQLGLLDFTRREMGSKAQLAYLQDSVLSYLSAILEREVSLTALAHPAVATLRTSDAETGGELAKTLRVYLENERHLLRTAEQLGIHRNSLAHRLKRITELAPLDLDDPVERAYLSSSLVHTRGGHQGHEANAEKLPPGIEL